jgi:hypothetical protein
VAVLSSTTAIVLIVLLAATPVPAGGVGVGDQLPDMSVSDATGASIDLALQKGHGSPVAALLCAARAFVRHATNA